MQNPALWHDNRIWQETIYNGISEAGILDEAIEKNIYNAFLAVPRSLFVDGQQQEVSLQDTNLSIGFDRILPRPSFLIRICSLAQLRKRMRILELGFGSGYLCAVMSVAGAQVFGVEHLVPLAQRTRKLLDSLGYHGVVIRRGEAAKGWPEVGPFDAIVSTHPVTSEQYLPLEQLMPGGILVAPAYNGSSVNLTTWLKTSGSFRRITFETAKLHDY